jgi:transcription elongation factor GreA-like protein/transcription elongation GreA/GreB family factor
MVYLKNFQERIRNGDFIGFMQLWDEYYHIDVPDEEEVIAILEATKASEAISRQYGRYAESLIKSTLWKNLRKTDLIHQILGLIFDLQTTNSEDLAQIAIEHLKNRYPNDPLFMEKLRLIGLRNRENFQGAISNFDLLTHFAKGNFVYHMAGWGTGEVIDSSLIREEVTIEFENVLGPQRFTFEKAFKNLRTLPKDHFYARRFGSPDILEKEARDNPTDVIRMLLRDLGPKTAVEIKDEIEELVIPASDWHRWWQTARAKLKKDTMIESPKDLKDPYRLRTKEEPHEISLHKSLEMKPGVHASVQMIYTFLRDHPETIKNQEFKTSLEKKLNEILEQEQLNESQKLQVLFLLDDLHVPKMNLEIERLIKEMAAPVEQICPIDILSFQKRALQLVQKKRSDWKEIFLDLLFVVESNLLRDYLVTELNIPETMENLKKKIHSLIAHPLSHPDIFVWYFQKIIATKTPYPFSDSAGKNDFFECLLILLEHLEKKPQNRDLAKKILSIVTANRYKIVRDIMGHSSVDEVKEYLLLVTKCTSMSDHDIKIIHAIGEGLHPSLSRLRKEKPGAPKDENIIYATPESFARIQQRIQHLNTTETLKNIEEINAARAHGDLRENAEYKSALERRDRIRSELKFLTDQLAVAEILTTDKVSTDVAGKGTVVHCKDSKGEHTHYTLLGPWDADPEKRILSLQSKLAQSIIGLGVDDTFEFQGEHYTITAIDNYFEQKV